MPKRGRPKGSTAEQTYFTKLLKQQPRIFRRVFGKKGLRGSRGRHPSPIQSLKVIGGTLKVKASKARVRIGNTIVEI